MIEDINSILQFVNLFSTNDLLDIFRHYHCHRYDDLMPNIVYQLNDIEMRTALAQYLEYYLILTPNENDERTLFLKEILTSHNINKFKTTLEINQFFEEPLFHIANKDYSLLKF